MIGELLYLRCDRCGGHLGRRLSRPAPYIWIADRPASLYTSHSEAIRAGEAAGWRLQSESIGGDVCAACVAREQGGEDE